MRPFPAPASRSPQRPWKRVRRIAQVRQQLGREITDLIIVLDDLNDNVDDGGRPRINVGFGLFQRRCVRQAS